MERKLNDEGLLLAFAVLVYLSVRIAFFFGPVHTDQQDEGIYLKHIMHGFLQDSENLCRMLGDGGTVNPIYIFSARWGFLALPRLLYLAGALRLVPYLTLFVSLAGMISLFFIARKLYGIREALLSSLFYSFLPVEIFFSTRVMPDASVNAFSVSSVALSLYGHPLLAALSLLAAYSIRPFVIPPLVAIFLFSDRKVAVRSVVNFVLLVLLYESAVSFLSGCAFLNARALYAGNLDNLIHANGNEFLGMEFLRASFASFYLIPMLFWKSSYGFMYFSVLSWIGFAGLLLKREWKWVIVVAASLIPFFLPFHADGTRLYFPPIQQRYMLFLSLPLSIGASRISGKRSLALLAMYVVISVLTINSFHGRVEGSVLQLKNAAALLPPASNVHVDYWGGIYLQYFSNMKFNISDVCEMGEGYYVWGGMRGLDIRFRSYYNLPCGPPMDCPMVYELPGSEPMKIYYCAQGG